MKTNNNNKIEFFQCKNNGNNRTQHSTQRQRNTALLEKKILFFRFFEVFCVFEPTRSSADWILHTHTLSNNIWSAFSLRWISQHRIIIINTTHIQPLHIVIVRYKCVYAVDTPLRYINSASTFCVYYCECYVRVCVRVGLGMCLCVVCIHTVKESTTHVREFPCNALLFRLYCAI